MSFRPGLVGGHCIGVDPYYLTHKGQAIGCYPEIILAGRRLNDGMGAYISSQLAKLMIRNGLQVYLYFLAQGIWITHKLLLQLY